MHHTSDMTFCKASSMKLLILFHASTLLASAALEDTTEHEYVLNEVEVSPECAVVLVTGGLVFGGLAAAATISLFSVLFEAVGFAAIGVEGGSSVASWQSTFPLVEKGSLFSRLQSISMSKTGASNLVALGSIGG